ncbi:hypothetical protein B0A48_10866 [Cryoendolithus antarcticus]|uniref:Uncharacterized protein n=1 Tax=Cryoendolithus antarcticus TaxID=1507870 RepID=A0A1V8SYL7_9PEZI|nr:hypothetical protein B0A48_10866 [Cryoendolithus antarcticus]
MKLSVDEYEALPVSVRRKYFSQHERLQIVQWHAAEKRSRTRPKSSWLDPPSPIEEPIRHDSVVDSSISNPTFPVTHSTQNLLQCDVPGTNTSWYLALPEKVKKQRFSPEERALLAAGCEAGAAYQAPWLATSPAVDAFRFTRPVSSACARRQPSVSSSEILDDSDDSTSAPRLASAQGMRQLETGEVAKVTMLRPRSRRQSEPARCAQAVSPPAYMAIGTAKERRKRSFRRSFALRPLPLPAPALTPLPSVPDFATSAELEPIKTPRKLSRKSMSNDSELAPDAQYFHSPEVRQTLRSLASPQLFDEAVNFGFPVVDELAALPSTADTSDHARKCSLTFSSSGEESTMPNSPVTPARSIFGDTTMFIDHPSSLHSSSSASMRQIAEMSEKTPDHFRSLSISNREMTLRMTLTRPDLRLPDVHSYSSEGHSPTEKIALRDDPLALRELPVCDDPTGSHGAFAVVDAPPARKGLKKVWKGWRKR